MPLSSGSSPSLGASKSDVIAAPSILKAARLSASVLPYLAAGAASGGNMRPKRPSNPGFAAAVNPRKGFPWFEYKSVGIFGFKLICDDATVEPRSLSCLGFSPGKFGFAANTHRGPQADNPSGVVCFPVLALVRQRARQTL